jgi:hypothetical protein
MCRFIGKRKPIEILGGGLLYKAAKRRVIVNLLNNFRIYRFGVISGRNVKHQMNYDIINNFNKCAHFMRR